MKKLTLLIFLAWVVQGCTSVQIDEQGQNVRVGYAGEFSVDGCRFITAVDVKAPRAFSPGAASTRNVINTVRNEAYKYNADAAKIVGEPSVLFKSSAYATVEYYECKSQDTND